jgi:hypothetical protein
LARKTGGNHKNLIQERNKRNGGIKKQTDDEGKAYIRIMIDIK